MPDIGAMSEGYNAQGVEAYVEALKTVVLTNAATEVQNISEIQTACEANWEGQARINFIENVKKEATHVANQYETLFQILNTQINNLQATMSNFDYSMIDRK